MSKKENSPDTSAYGLDNYMGRLVYPVMERLASRKMRQAFCRLQDLQYHSCQQLKERQEEKLMRLIGHAYENVVFYHKKFDSLGINPKRIRGIDDLSSLPTLEKAELRQAFPRAVRAENMSLNRFIPDRTSGSSGEPLNFFHDRNSLDDQLASFLLFNQWAGICPGERTVHIGAPEKIPFKKRLYNRIRRHTILSAFEISPANLDRISHQLNRLNPALIEGYSSSVYQLARFLIEKNVRLKPRAVICTSDTLLSLKTVQQAFDCPVFNRYGNRELCGALAQSCLEGNGLHINTELSVLEVVDQQGVAVGPGERGRILVTDLTNYAMPFIRYETGDTAVVGKGCGCGRGFPVISKLEGRSSESLSLSGGRRISSIAFSHYLFVYHTYVEHFSLFQAEQFSPERIHFRFVPIRPVNKKIKAALQRDLQDLVGPEVRIKVEFVEAIIPATSGKRAVILSHLHKSDG